MEEDKTSDQPLLKVLTVSYNDLNMSYLVPWCLIVSFSDLHMSY